MTHLLYMRSIWLSRFYTEEDLSIRLSISAHFLANSFSSLLILLFSICSISTSGLYCAFPAPYSLCAWSMALSGSLTLLHSSAFSSCSVSITSSIFDSFSFIATSRAYVGMSFVGGMFIANKVIANVNPFVVISTFTAAWFAKNGLQLTYENHIKCKKSIP